MTRKTAESQITLNLGDSSTNTLTQVYNALDIVIRELIGRGYWQGRIRDGFIRTTSGRYQYPLEPDFRMLQGEFRIVEDSRVLRRYTQDEFNDTLPDPSDGAGVPYAAMINEVMPCRQNPASKIRFVSSSASDTQVATIYGEVYGLPMSEELTLTGTTAVLTANAYTQVYRVQLASAAVGTVTLTTNSTTGDTARPTVANAGNTTIGTIAVAATAPTTLISQGSKLRISMAQDVAGDRDKAVRIEGYAINETNAFDRQFRRETITTDATNATTSVVGSLSWTTITAITKSWDSTHTLLIKADPNATLIADLGPDARDAEFPQVRFYHVPNGHTVHYRYLPTFRKLLADDDTIPVPSLYHQMVTEWAEKLVRGWHGDFQRGVVSLQGDVRFDKAIMEAQRGTRLDVAPLISMGSGRKRQILYPGIINRGYPSE